MKVFNTERTKTLLSKLKENIDNDTYIIDSQASFNNFLDSSLWKKKVIIIAKKYGYYMDPNRIKGGVDLSNIESIKGIDTQYKCIINIGKENVYSTVKTKSCIFKNGKNIENLTIDLSIYGRYNSEITNYDLSIFENCTNLINCNVYETISYWYRDYASSNSNSTSYSVDGFMTSSSYFNNCTNLINCNCKTYPYYYLYTNVPNGSSPYERYVTPITYLDCFKNCKLLTNCTAINGLGNGFKNCKLLTNCIGKSGIFNEDIKTSKNSTYLTSCDASSFINCDNLSNCYGVTGYRTHLKNGITPEEFAVPYIENFKCFCFKDCNNLMNCKAKSRGAEENITYLDVEYYNCTGVISCEKNNIAGDNSSIDHRKVVDGEYIDQVTFEEGAAGESTYKAFEAGNHFNK